MFAYAGGSGGSQCRGTRNFGPVRERPAVEPSGRIGGTSTGLVAIGTPFVGPSSPLGSLHLFEPNGNSRRGVAAVRDQRLPRSRARCWASRWPGRARGGVPARQRRAQASRSSGVSSPSDRVRQLRRSAARLDSSAAAHPRSDPQERGGRLAADHRLGYVTIDSPLFGTAELEKIGTELWLDVFVPVDPARSKLVRRRADVVLGAGREPQQRVPGTSR